MKEIHNGEPASRKITLSGICKLDKRQADVTSFFSGTMECKTDLQKTYRFQGYKCSLQLKNVFSNPACMDECPLIRKKYL